MKPRRKNQTRSKSKSRRAPMRRHQSPKRHGVTSRARLRSRTKTKTRGRSRKAMRGGAVSGSSKKSSMIPWIAGAALVGAGGLLFGARYIQQLQTQLKQKTTELQGKTEEVASLSSQPGLIGLQEKVAALNQQIAKTEEATREAARGAALKLQQSEAAVKAARVAVTAATAKSDKEKQDLKQELQAKTQELAESTRVNIEAQTALARQQQLSEEARAAVEATTEFYLKSLVDRYEEKTSELLQLIETKMKPNTNRTQKLVKDDITQFYQGLLALYKKKLTHEYTARDKIVEFLAKQETLCNYIKTLRENEDFIITVKSILNNDGTNLVNIISNLDFLFFKFLIQKTSKDQFDAIKEESRNTCNVEVQEYIQKLQQMYDLERQLK